jgi:cytochrome P450
MERRNEVPRASLPDVLRTIATVMVPVAARGAIIRRQRIVNAAQRIDADSRAVRQMRRLRDKYGPGPVQVRVPGRRFTLVLEPEDVVRVLAETPVPFAADTREKRAALGQFQPHGVLVSPPEQRPSRRRLNETALSTGDTLHPSASHLTDIVRAEVRDLVDEDRDLTWDRFEPVWWRIVRRFVLGDSARDDEAVTDTLRRLRLAANWSLALPARRRLRADFLRQMERAVERAEHGSLAAAVAGVTTTPGVEPHEQLPQWLFAFDATSWATFRALALICTHPDAERRARTELAAAPDMPFLRACMLDSLRLWPTTPAILRDATRDTEWKSGTLPAGASVIVFAPFLHRDETRLEQAHRFAPELWLHARDANDWPLVPFSSGPAMCPGRNVVLLTASLSLAALLESRAYELSGAELGPDIRLPGTLSPFRLSFRMRSFD